MISAADEPEGQPVGHGQAAADTWIHRRHLPPLRAILIPSQQGIPAPGIQEAAHPGDHAQAGEASNRL
jgi:hypothetical protein